MTREEWLARRAERPLLAHWTEEVLLLVAYTVVAAWMRLRRRY